MYEEVSMRTQKLNFTEQNGDNEYENYAKAEASAIEDET